MKFDFFLIGLPYRYLLIASLGKGVFIRTLHHIHNYLNISLCKKSTLENMFLIMLYWHEMYAKSEDIEQWPNLISYKEYKIAIRANKNPKNTGDGIWYRRYAVRPLSLLIRYTG